MPIYEFQCSGCQHQFEELVRSSAQRPDIACPQCASRKVDRKPSVFAARRATTTAAAASLPRAGGCGRCGDPNGPCSAN